MWTNAHHNAHRARHDRSKLRHTMKGLALQAAVLVHEATAAAQRACRLAEKPPIGTDAL